MDDTYDGVLDLSFFVGVFGYLTLDLDTALESLGYFPFDLEADLLDLLSASFFLLSLDFLLFSSLLLSFFIQIITFKLNNSSSISSVKRNVRRSKIVHKLMFYNHTVSTPIQSFQQCHQVIHG